MEYADNQARLAKLLREIAEFERIDAYCTREGHAETARDADFHSRYLPLIPQLREERKALESVMRASPGTGHL